jgi:hypothetical protein
MTQPKNVLFWIGVKSTDPRQQRRHGNFKYLDISEECWKLWCAKNDVEFVPYRLADVGEEYRNLSKHVVTWTRWFDLFRVLEERGINPKKICTMDGSTLIRSDAPNFIEESPDEGLTVFRSLENLRWLAEGVDGYKDFFNGFSFDLRRYFCAGIQIFNPTHKVFLEKLRGLYNTFYQPLMVLQNEKVKRGTDQIVINYLAQMENIKVNLDALPQKFYCTHPERFDWFGHNWQLKDTTPFFLKYNYLWMFSGFPDRGRRYEMMKKTWDIIKKEYR